MDGMSGSLPRFFMSGVTAALLNREGKIPSEKDRLASLEISSEKTSGQAFIREEDYWPLPVSSLKNTIYRYQT